MPGPALGMFFYLYLIVDIFSRKIVGWEAHERESADLAATLIRQAVLAEGCALRPLVLHADNGSPMKGATMKVTMEKPGITASCSIRLDQAVFSTQVRSALTSAFAVSMSLRMMATIASFAGFPYATATCSIPDDHISPRRSALFMARSVLRDIRDGGRPC